MLRQKFHDTPLFPDAVLDTADEAVAAFSADMLSRYDFKKIGYVVRQGGGYISVFKYNRLRAADASPAQRVYLSGTAIRHVVDMFSAPDALFELQASAAKITEARFRALQFEMREALAMARAFIPETPALPAAAVPVSRYG